MRILQLSTFHRQIGGAENYMHALAHKLRERGHTVSLFAGSPDDELDEPEQRIVRRPDFDRRTIVEDEGLKKAFLAHVANFHPDLIHVHNLATFPASFPRAFQAVRAPVVQTVHDFSPLCPNAWCILPNGTPCAGGPGAQCFEHGCQENAAFGARNVLASKLRNHFVQAGVAAFISPSTALADMCVKHGFEPLHHLPYFADESSFGGLAAFNSTLEQTEREPHHILFLGRLVREKGVEHLIRAMPKILKAIPEARLSILGTGAEEQALKTEALNLGIATSVDFHGKIPHADVPTWLARATVNVLPSVWCENSPLSCYESLLAGLPMVASDIGGLPDLVRDGVTGLLARPRDPDHLADQVIRLVEDRELHQRLSQGARREFERYDADSHLGKIEEIYGQVLEQQAKTSRNGSGIDGDFLAALQAMSVEYAQAEDWGRDTQAWAYRKIKGNPVRRVVNKLLDLVSPG